MEKFLYLLCVLFVYNIREIREICVRLIIAQYLVYLSEFLFDGILVDFDDIKQSGRALCLAVFDERELLVIAEIEEGIRLFRIRSYLLVFRNQILHDVHASL